ncbi:FtsX-like permease family protein [Phocaeicola coprocola]|uniref:FtsX-like permease family protein n=1 Tax=Phocaeicola coprocola TaxID=310298 RepID=UPI001C38ACE4|nr:FtsX-like permease family protein [Phocaeicola coprocola]MBV3866837.1 FtsX-like permease family protein [Phocaeicola coprocola]MBV4008015.1 FtsX-like permease family protein [Phocaeicola coprocola]MBV4032516.1 FtsX-like permease family protein [Phocaeicola coprocola]MBV4039069.1 FtsX-like permease family protein [Phocaeicola coprocola]MBV4060702.1 FtsX-like permease family protein [Phocaeicola coprocola]
MNFPFYIARRYLFSKKSHNAINVISAISVCGVALATLALVCTLSVFNGFQDLVTTFFTAFDPQLKITAVRGKVFDGQDKRVLQLKKMPDVEVYSESLEDNVMVQYQGRQAMAVVKGVEDNFDQLTPIDSILFGRGDLLLHDEVVDYAISGIQLLSTLGSGIRFLDPLEIYAPRRGAKVNMANPSTAFVTGNLFSSGLVFAVNQEKYDASYILTSIDFARRLFQYTTEVSAINLKLKAGADTDAVKKHIQDLLGDDFLVQDRYEQQADTYRIMEIEKLISYLFLTFILMIACFNVIGSLSMLIIDKRDDVVTLRNLGASDRQIVRIFLFEGRMISFFGAFAGVVLGLLLCWLQQEYGLIALGSSGSFVVDAYPVSVHASDVLLIFITVLLIGFLSVWYPVRFLSKRLLNK